MVLPILLNLRRPPCMRVSDTSQTQTVEAQVLQCIMRMAHHLQEKLETDPLLVRSAELQYVQYLVDNRLQG